DPEDRPRRLPGDRRRGLRPDRLPAPRRRPLPVRDQHDPGLHPDQPVPDDALGGRLLLRRRLREGPRARGRAPRRPRRRDARAGRPAPMTFRPARRVGGPGRRTRTVRRRSAGLTPVRAGAALAMLLSAAAIYGLAATSAFGFSQLRVEGATITSEDAIRARLALPKGMNLFEIRTDPLAAVLKEIPAVADADVSVGLPDTVTVQVHERRPILIWRVDDRRWYVDDTGLLFADAPAQPPGDYAALPVIADDRLASRAFNVGATIDPVDLDVASRLA